MIIISKSKDYYDHQAHIFGGGDPKIRYERKSLILSEGESGIDGKEFELFGAKKDVLLNGFVLKDDFVSEWRWLVVCGKPYSLIEYRPTPYASPILELFDIEKHKEFLLIPSELKGSRKYKKRMQERVFTQNGVANEFLIELSKQIGQPVFIIRNHGQLRGCDVPTIGLWLDLEIPMLSDLGFAALYPPEQLYQDISYFVGNILKESPDIIKSSPQSDKEKIVSHGLDLKKSFRHRT